MDFRSTAGLIPSTPLNDAWSRFCNSPLVGFTHSLIGVYIKAIQSVCSGTHAAVGASHCDQESSAEVCVFCLSGLVCSVSADCVDSRCCISICFWPQIFSCVLHAE